MDSCCESLTLELLEDTRRMLMVHSQHINVSPLYIYQSALPFAPRTSSLYKTYKKEAESAVRVILGSGNEWPRLLQSTYAHQEGKVRCLAFSPDGKHFASGGDDKIVRVWEVNSGSVITTVKNPSRMKSLVFSPDGVCIASADSCGPIKMWDFSTGITFRILQPDLDGCGSFVAIAFTGDGAFIAGVYGDDSISVWDTVHGHLVHTIRDYHQVRSSTFPKDRNVVISPAGRILSINLDSGLTTRICTNDGWRADYTVCIEDENGRRTVSADTRGPTGKPEVWALPNTSTPKTPQILLQYSEPEEITHWAISRDGKRVASVVDDSIHVRHVDGGCICLPNIENQTALKIKIRVVSLTFSPDGNYLVSAGTSGSVKIWDVARCNPNDTCMGACRPNPITSIAFSPDGTRIGTGCEDGSVRLWDADNGTPLKSVYKLAQEQVPEPVKYLHFCTGNNAILVSTDRKRVYVADLSSETGILEEVGAQWDGRATCGVFSRKQLPLPAEPYTFDVEARFVWRANPTGVLRELSRLVPDWRGIVEWTEGETVDLGRRLICRIPDSLEVDDFLRQAVTYSGSRVALISRYGCDPVIIETDPEHEVRIEARGNACLTQIGRQNLIRMFETLSFLSGIRDCHR